MRMICSLLAVLGLMTGLAFSQAAPMEKSRSRGPVLTEEDGSRQQELTGPATVQATVITNFGRPEEKRQSLSLRLKDARDVVDIGTITLDGRDDPLERATK